MKSVYKKCISCGKYFLDSSENNKYCSKECKAILDPVPTSHRYSFLYVSATSSLPSPRRAPTAASLRPRERATSGARFHHTV